MSTLNIPITAAWTLIASNTDGSVSASWDYAVRLEVAFTATNVAPTVAGRICAREQGIQRGVSDVGYVWVRVTLGSVPNAISVVVTTGPGVAALTAAQGAAGGTNAAAITATDDVLGSTGKVIHRQGYVDYMANYAPSNYNSSSVAASFLAAATDALASNKQLFVRRTPGGLYLPSVVTVNSAAGLDIIGDGPESTYFRSTSAAYMMDIRGGSYDSTSTALTSNVAAGDVVLPVVSTARLTAGQWINIQSDQVWNASSGKAARYGELKRVKSIDSSTQVTLYSGLDYAYTTANSGRVNACPMGAGVRMRGIGFTNDNPLTSAAGVAGGIVFRQIQRLSVEDIYGSYLDGPLLTYVGCVDGTVKRVNAEYLADDENNGRYGYVHNLGDATRGFLISDGHTFACRHHVTTAATSTSTIGGVPVHNRAVSLTGTAHTNATFSSHEEGDDITFENCISYNGNDMGFELRALHSKLKNCDVVGGLGTGVIVQSAASGSEIRGFSCNGLTGIQSARSNPTVGISLAASDTLVDGFRIENIGNSAILITANRQRIKNGYTQKVGVSQNPAAIRFSGASIDHHITNIDADGGGVASAQGMFSSSSITGCYVNDFVCRQISAGSANAGTGVANLIAKSVQGSSVTETVLASVLV